jgi:hypothetical protein
MRRFLGLCGSGNSRSRRRAAARRSSCECLEGRLLPATLVVNTTADDITVDDTLSLREAIEISNGTLGLADLSASEQAQVSGDLSQPNTIDFAIPRTGVPIIIPLSALPEITHPVTIDGTSQPFVGTVALAGLSAGNGGGAGVDGLTISAGSSVVEGMIIGLFSGSGIVLTSSGGNVIRGCLIGTDLASDVTVGNGGDGIQIAGSPNNTVGGTDPAERNVISGNKGNGVGIGGTSATGNVVAGDFIGTDTTGMKSVSNQGSGVRLSLQASNNTIGGTASGAGSVISGNAQDGILINSAAASNRVQGNTIGSNAMGTGPLSGIPSNEFDGVVIEGASGNLIGGSDPGAGNLITDNSMNGINIFSTTDGTDTTGNIVQGNRFGSLPTGTGAQGNVADGILISAALDNTIGGTTPGAGNLISASGQNGVEIALEASGNLVQGNLIGTDSSGTQTLSNLASGVFIAGGSGNTIGGTAPGARNVISANVIGVHILGNATGGSSNSVDNQILGNLIGTDITGTQVLSNLTNGVLIQAASSNTVGGTTAGARNIISANGGDGVTISQSSSIIVQGNYIGLDVSGTQRLDNTGNGITVSGSTGVQIGGATSGAGNVISRNERDGVSIEFDSAQTLLQGNLIGVDFTGAQIASNFGNGVSVSNSSATTIGGTTSMARNVISANGGDGIKITDSADGALILGNYVGTDITGAIRTANLGNGVEVTNQAQNVTIGGATAAARNLISANQGSGVVLSIGSGVGNTVQGNFIGTDASGTRALGNRQYGVLISQSQANVIGGATPSTANVISNEENVIAGNSLAGILILGNFATGNVVEGNLIGTDVTGAQAVPNAQGGVAITSGATGNTIGGTTPAARNVISGNLTDGVTIAGQGTSGNTVEDNDIGTDATGTHPLANFLRGIFIQNAANNTIGGTTISAGNLISANGQDGILITNPSATGNLIELNAIGTDITVTRTADAAGHSLGNHGNGISIIAAPQNTVTLNVISGNSQSGISIANLGVATGQGVSITGNIIGADISGTLPLGNGGDGILLDTVTGEVIGGSGAPALNVISANGQAGVEIRGSGSTGNLIEGDSIGTNLAGTASLANATGILVNGAPGNTIAGNVISGNSLPQSGGAGVEILGSSASGNVIAVNLIGTNTAGAQAVANDIGVFINGAPKNTITANLISGNIRADTSGIGIEILGAGASGNLVQSNLIGTDISGKHTLVPARADLGILISGTPGGNTVGGTNSSQGNVISGFKVAIEIFAAQSQFNPTPGSTVEGNKIGTDITGEAALGNDVGIYINGVPRNQIGGTVPGARNIISANTTGIYLLGSTTTGNQIQGNLIGLDAAGKLPLGNYIGIFADAASSNTIGGTSPGARNYIAGNKRNGPDGSTGVYLFDKAVNNLVAGNSIGTNTSGRSGNGLAMGDYGVLLFNAPKNNVPRSGKGKNRIVGSGIAAFREFTGSTSSGKSSKSGTTGTAAPRHGHAPAGPRPLLRAITR